MKLKTETYKHQEQEELDAEEEANGPQGNQPNTTPSKNLKSFDEIQIGPETIDAKIKNSKGGESNLSGVKVIVDDQDEVIEEEDVES